MDVKKILNFLKDSKTVTAFVKLIAEWFFEFGWIQQGKNISIQKSSEGIVINGRDVAPSSKQAEVIPTGAFALSYSGAVVTVGESRATLGSGFITLGLTRNTLAIAETKIITQTVYIYYKFTTTTVWTLEIATTLPVQDNNTLYFILGRVFWDSVAGKISSVSSYYPYGNIHYPARFL